MPRLSCCAAAKLFLGAAAACPLSRFPMPREPRSSARSASSCLTRRVPGRTCWRRLFAPRGTLAEAIAPPERGILEAFYDAKFLAQVRRVG